MSSARRRFLQLAGAVMAAPALLHRAVAQGYPVRAVRVIVPFAPGGITDVLARLIAEKWSENLGKQFYVENVTGGSGNIGMGQAAKAAPDGYTILVHSSTFSAGQALYKSLPYDTLHDFASIIPLGLQPTVLVAAPSKGWKSVSDLVAAAKAHPGTLTFASAGIGSASHLAAERLRFSAGFNALHVPYRGPNEALSDVITGRVDFYFLPIAPALPLINDGKLVALAVSTATRNPTLPNVPTTAEAGLKDAAYAFWTGVFAPAATPKPIVNRIYEETRKALDVQSVKDRLAKVGVEPMPMSMAEFDAYFRADVASTVKLAHDAGIPQTD